MNKKKRKNTKTTDNCEYECGCTISLKYCTFCGKNGEVIVMTDDNTMLFLCKKCSKQETRKKNTYIYE